MDKFDLVDELTKYGVDESSAAKVKATITGRDLMDLVSYLKNNGQGVQLNKASQILGKYGIKLGSKKTMGDNYLNAKYESVRAGKSLDETFGVMTKIDEGFSYAVEVSEQNRDRVLDWLDENAVEYQATSPLSYRVECSDRDGAYRTGRALSEILRKPTVRDSVEIEEKMSKNPNKRVNDAKAKMAKITPKDPNREAATFRSGAGYHKGETDPRKADKGARGAKYKPRYDEEIEETITEGVMGMMKPVNPLFRLRELAGLPATLADDDFAGIEIAEIPQDPNSPLSAGPVDTGEPADMDVDGMGADPVADPMDDMDGGMDADDHDFSVDDTMADLEDPMAPVDPMGDMGVPGEIGSDPLEDPAMDMGADMDMGMDPMAEPAINVAEPAPVVGAPVPGMPVQPAGAAMAPTQSEAMGQIEDALNNIQTGLADIRLSEYKSLIQKLQDLTNQAQMMGRDYLGERFERKKK